MLSNISQTQIKCTDNAMGRVVHIMLNVSHYYAGQEKTQVRLPGASKFCSWASENGSLVAWWASETSLSSLVSDNSSQKQLKNLRLQD